jgi:hypothetical protein
MTDTIKKEDLIKRIANADMPFKSATFIKRTSADVRHMIFRLPGEDAACGAATPLSRTLDDLARDVLTVWDCNKADYRRISFEHVDKVIIDNEEYVIEYK